MSAEALSTKYIDSMVKTFNDLKRTKGPIVISEERADEIFGYVKAYLEDAKYFRDQKQFETALTSIAYCEGLLDALKLIGAAKTQSAP